MASQLPAALKSAGLQRFAVRAAQIEKYKPIASYWLEYYILQQILTRSLHNASPEASAYAAQLMDKLEATKTQYLDEPAVTDDVAAQAYMEQFALETLARAEKAQDDDAVTKQTVDILQAAATFLDSTSIWGELSAESRAKVKFAKFHALRIVKALKDGRDPNESNPKPNPVEPVNSTAEAEIQDELRRLEHDSGATLQPLVEEVVDRDVTHSLGSEGSKQVTTTGLDSTTVPEADTSVSSGGGYFPSTELPPEHWDPPIVHPMDTTEHVASPTTHIDAKQFYSNAQLPPTAVPSVVTPAPLIPPSSTVQQTGFKTDDDAVMAAQKHAKWAISALNFEDVPTAVRELRIALESLGGL